MKKIISLVLTLSFISNLKSQVFGTLNVPSTYTSIASVVTAMNQQGVFGNVVVAVAAGYTETAPLGGYSLTATGTSTSTILFQKSGVGRFSWTARGTVAQYRRNFRTYSSPRNGSIRIPNILRFFRLQ